MLLLFTGVRSWLEDDLRRTTAALAAVVAAGWRAPQLQGEEGGGEEGAEREEMSPGAALLRRQQVLRAALCALPPSSSAQPVASPPPPAQPAFSTAALSTHRAAMDLFHTATHTAALFSTGLGGASPEAQGVARQVMDAATAAAKFTASKLGCMRTATQAHMGPQGHSAAPYELDIFRTIWTPAGEVPIALPKNHKWRVWTLFVANKAPVSSPENPDVVAKDLPPFSTLRDPPAGYLWCEQKSRDTDFLYETRLAAWSVLLVLHRQLEALPVDQRPAPAVMATLRAAKESPTFCEGSSATIIGSYLKTTPGQQQLDLACADSDAKLSIKDLKIRHGQKGTQPWPGAGRGDVMKARREEALKALNATAANLDGWGTAMDEVDGHGGEEEEGEQEQGEEGEQEQEGGAQKRGAQKRGAARAKRARSAGGGVARS